MARSPHYEYDPEKRKQAKVYTRIKIVAGLVNGVAVSVLALLAFFFLGWSALLEPAFPGLLAVPLMVVAVMAFLTLVQFPLRFYFGHIYEHHYNLSRQTFRAWFVDYAKSVVLEIVFSVVTITLVYAVLGQPFWWIYAAGIYFLLGVFLDTIYPVMILPLFYKLSPFTDRVQRARLLEMVKEAGSKNIEDVLVAKESEKSVKANALFTGVGKTKKIVLFDTLLDNFTPDEVETVIGHELGHYVNRDIWKGIILSTVLLFPMLLVIGFALGSAGVQPLNAPAGLPLYLALFIVLGLILMPIENAFSRRWERAADWFGLTMSRKPEAQISTEKRLADLALSDDAPHRLVELVLFTHPAASRRITMVKEWQQKRGKR